ncbi:MucR family transcriptional regulator, partial [Sphingobium jiangsuense]
MAEIEQPDYTTLTVQLLSAYVANNKVDSGDLATLIQSTRAALVGDGAGGSEPEFKPAVSVEDSLASREHIISLIDGRPYKMLRRHLAHHGLSPEQYRARYGLPESYPLVAPAYAELRRDVARRMGLGHTAKPAEPAAPQQAVKAPAAKPVERKAVRPAPAAKPASNPAPAAKAVEKAPAQPAKKPAARKPGATAAKAVNAAPAAKKPAAAPTKASAA